MSHSQFVGAFYVLCVQACSVMDIVWFNDKRQYDKFI